jgi:hypothetical protein
MPLIGASIAAARAGSPFRLQPTAPTDRVVTSTPVLSTRPAPRQVPVRAIVRSDGVAFEWPHAPLFKLSRETKTA